MPSDKDVGHGICKSALWYFSIADKVIIMYLNGDTVLCKDPFDNKSHWDFWFRSQSDLDCKANHTSNRAYMLI